MSFLRYSLCCALLYRQCLSTNLLKRPIHFSSFLDQIIQFKLSDIGEGIAEVQVKDWHVKVGDKVKEFDEICLVQSDKASVTITSRYEGTIKKLHYEIDEIAKVGQPLIDIEMTDESELFADKSATTPDPVQEKKLLDKSAPYAFSDSVKEQDKIIAAPAVRKMIREGNLEASKILGTGKDGRVLKEDVLKYLVQPIQDKASESIIENKLDKIIPVRGYSRAMIKSMTESLKIPHFGYNDEYFMDKLIEARNELNVAGQKKGIKCSYMPLIIKATSLALLQFPIINSSLDEKMENVLYKSSHNISLAIDTPGGLVVPNVKNCNLKSVWEIAKDLDRLLQFGKEQKFSKEDLIDGTFSISNIGAIGSGTYVSPVIFSPQVAIAALGRVQKLPRFNADGNVVARNIINVSFAADHRVVDGATMARFSNLLKEYIENPTSMIGEMR